MPDPIREFLEHEKAVAKADLKYACDDDAAFDAETAIVKRTGLLAQYDELLAYVAWLDEFVQQRGSYTDVHDVITRCPEWLPEAMKHHAAVLCPRPTCLHERVMHGKCMDCEQAWVSDR